jgi:hypothetical protein
VASLKTAMFLNQQNLFLDKAEASQLSENVPFEPDRRTVTPKIRNRWPTMNIHSLESLAGVPPGDAEKFKAAFNIKTIRDLADCKYFHWATAIKTLADAEG